MSLATAGGGGAGMGAGAGLSMAMSAHNTGGAAVAAPSFSHSQVPPGSGAGGYAAAPGTSFAALGADLLDKNQNFLNSKCVRASARLPIVAVDLYGDDGDVAYFPPQNEGGGGEEDDDEYAVMMKLAKKMTEGSRFRSAGSLAAGGGGVDLRLKRDDDAGQKAVRKYLSKGHGHASVLDNAAVLDSDSDENENGGSDGAGDDEVVVVPRPHLFMGCRRISDLSPATRARYESLLPPSDGSESDGDALAIHPEATATSSSPVALTEIAMDGDVSPKGDDFDRIAFKMRLHKKKKIMTMLPEEALGVLLAKARRQVRDKYIEENPDSELANGADGGDGGEDDGETYMDYPPAFAIPGWAAMDASLEALIDAAGGSSTPCGPSLHQRSIAALIGALAPSNQAAAGKPQPSKLAKLLMETCQSKDKEAELEAVREAALRGRGEEPVSPNRFVPLVLLVGATAEGIEMTAVQISKPQEPTEELHCPFGNVSVLASVCHRTNDYAGQISSTLDELRDLIGVLLPESEEPTSVVTYGTLAVQIALSKALTSTLARYGEEGLDNDDWDGWDQEMSVIHTRPDAVASGLAVLAASTHGRVRVVVSVKGTDDKMRPKAKAGVTVQDAAACAVAVSFNYRDGDVYMWTPPKTIFDFDRRVPAGPYRINFSAAECAAHASSKGCSVEDDDELEEKTRKLEGSGGIPKREAAALGFRFRILQKTSRGGNDDANTDGGWIAVGDPMRPLTMEHSQKEEGESGEDHLVACEASVLEISLSPVGLITTGMTTNGETIVQATKSARNSKVLKWVGIVGAVVFFGGFLVKSYVEERVFERDTQRLLAYYKRAAPNSFYDGDERQARYLVWKYKGKKAALWRRLEVKYNIPVKHAWEWNDDDEVETAKDEDETEDLDGDDGKKEKTNDGEEL